MNNSTRRSLAIALLALGSTADDVADLLAAGGWRGHRNESSVCPVAAYLRTVVPDATAATVSPTRATVWTSDGEHVEADVTPAVSDFVTAFDLGDYPELAVTSCDDNGDAIDDE